MASPTASGSSKANAAPPAAEVPSRPSKRRRVSTPQIKDEEHTKPSLADSVLSSAEDGIKAVFSSAEEGIKAAIASACGKHADAINKHVRMNLEQKDVAVQQKEAELQQKEAELQQKITELRQKDAELQEKIAKLQQKDAELQQKDIELQQKDAELQQKDIELQQNDAELQVCRAKLADIAAALSKAPATIETKSASGAIAAADETPANDEIPAANETLADDEILLEDETLPEDGTLPNDESLASDETPAADEVSEKTLLPLRACEISIYARPQRHYAVVNLQEMLEKLGAKGSIRQVPRGGWKMFYHWQVPNVFVVTNREAYNQGCQEVTLPGKYHGKAARTVWWEWVKDCLACWERMDANEYCFEEPDEAMQLTEEAWKKVQLTPLSLHFHAIAHSALL
jgi:TolA-binding protein